MNVQKCEATYTQCSCGPQTSTPHQWGWQGRKASGPSTTGLGSDGSTWRPSGGAKEWESEVLGNYSGEQLQQKLHVTEDNISI